MKSLQYTFGISLSLFITIVCKQDFYSKYIFENPVPMSYSLEISDIFGTTCARLCLSTEGCSYFHWYNRSCYIPSPDPPDNSSVTVEYIYVHDDLKDNCNLDGYNTTFGGVLCLKVYDIPMNWTAANATCEQDGGQLLVMRTGVFHIKLEALKSLQPRRYWIGGNDLATEGEFKWIDGSDVTTEGWQNGQPDDYLDNEDCLHFIGLVINDKNCTCDFLFLCEKPLLSFQ